MLALLTLRSSSDTTSLSSAFSNTTTTAHVRSQHLSSSSIFRLLRSHATTGIGQCVGARNHRYFVLFLAWAFLFCAWVFASLLALNVRGASSSDRNIDPQHIAIIALYVLRP